MRLSRNYHGVHRATKGCVATIGNFDGVHLGHQVIIDQLLAQAHLLSAPSTVVVFEPQPQEYFCPDDPPPRLTRWREKFLLLSDLGIDHMVCLRFDSRLAAVSAETFVEDILVKGLGVRHLVVGDDFRFGSKRKGDFRMLMDLGAGFGFDVERARTFELDEERVSSTRVRNSLCVGDMDQARRLLGRYYAIAGRVVHGDKQGRSFGFPTLNITLHRRSCAVAGIYAVKVAGLAERSLPGAAYVGTRPAVNGEHKVLEVYILDYDNDCYGRHVNVEFVRKLRDDSPFDSIDALTRQIGKDVEQARQVLASFADQEMV